MAEQSLRETIEAKFVDDVDPPQTPPAGETAPDAPEAVPTTPIEAPDKLPEAVAPTSVVKDTLGKAPEAPKAPEAVKPEPQPVFKTPEGEVRAPPSWKPEVRELFKSLPAPVQQEVMRRERDMARFVQETRDVRQHFDNFINICRPYNQLIALDGGDPLKTFGEFLKTGAILRMGTPVEKAQAIANAVRQFDVDVQALDHSLAALYGGQVPQQQQVQPQQYRDPRVDELFTTIQQTQQQQEAALEAQQQQEIGAFMSDPKHEFFNDLRPDIADLLEFNARRGVRMTLGEAYDRAAAMNPAISKLITQRRAMEDAKRNNQMVADKKRAMTGAPGSPIPATMDGTDASLRQTLNAAFDAHSQRV